MELKHACYWSVIVLNSVPVRSLFYISVQFRKAIYLQNDHQPGQNALLCVSRWTLPLAQKGSCRFGLTIGLSLIMVRIYYFHLYGLHGVFDFNGIDYPFFLSTFLYSVGHVLPLISFAVIPIIFNYLTDYPRFYFFSWDNIGTKTFNG